MAFAACIRRCELGPLDLNGDMRVVRGQVACPLRRVIGNCAFFGETDQEVPTVVQENQVTAFIVPLHPDPGDVIKCNAVRVGGTRLSHQTRRRCAMSSRLPHLRLKARYPSPIAVPTPPIQSATGINHGAQSRPLASQFESGFTVAPANRKPKLTSRTR